MAQSSLHIGDNPLSLLDTDQCHACSLNSDFRYRKFYKKTYNINNIYTLISE